METKWKRCLKGAAGEQMPKLLIKQEVEWLAEDSHAPDVANQEVGAGMESIRSIKMEEDPYHTYEEAHAVQEFTPGPRTNEFIKAELILDENTMSSSEENCKQHLLGVADDHRAEVSKSDKEVCRSRFKLPEHLESAQSITPFECELCSRPFKNKYYLGKHLSTHGEHGERDFACHLCERKFYSQKWLQNHIEAHSKPKHKCEFCSHIFRDKCRLETHLRTHATDRKREFACDICQGKFYSKIVLWAHKKIHTREQHLKPLPANDTGVRMKAELMSDEESKDEGNDRDSVTHVEKSQEPALATVEKGTRVGIAEDSVTCKVCHNSYPGESIERHMLINHGDVTYKLRECLQQSTSEKNISTQYNRARPFACEQCGSRFLAKDSLKQHMNTQHTKNRIPLCCEFCEKKYYSKRGLKEHLGTHTGVTVSCEVCGACFTRVQSLRTHMVRKHTAKTQPFTPDPQAANGDAIRVKEELKSDEEF